MKKLQVIKVLLVGVIFVMVGFVVNTQLAWAPPWEAGGWLGPRIGATSLPIYTGVNQENTGESSMPESIGSGNPLNQLPSWAGGKPTKNPLAELLGPYSRGMMRQALTDEEWEKLSELMSLPHKQPLLAFNNTIPIGILMDAFYYQISWQDAQFIQNSFNKLQGYAQSHIGVSAQQKGVMEYWESIRQHEQQGQQQKNQSPETPENFDSDINRPAEDVESSSVPIETQGYVVPLSPEQNVVNWKNDIFQADSYNGPGNLPEDNSINQLDTSTIDETIKEINRRLKRIEEELNK